MRFKLRQALENKKGQPRAPNPINDDPGTLPSTLLSFFLALTSLPTIVIGKKDRMGIFHHLGRKKKPKKEGEYDTLENTVSLHRYTFYEKKEKEKREIKANKNGDDVGRWCQWRHGSTPAL